MANLPVTQFYASARTTPSPSTTSTAGPRTTAPRAGRPAPPTAPDHQRRLVHHPRRRRLQDRVDPTDPNTVYSQLQNGVLVRFDRRTGQRVDIRPREAAGEEGYPLELDSR